jgi:hypothetical protein
MRSLTRDHDTLVFTDDDGVVITIQSTDWDRAAEMVGWFIHFKEGTKGLALCPFCMYPILPFEELAEGGLAHQACLEDDALDRYQAAENERLERELDVALPPMDYPDEPEPGPPGGF